MIRLPPEILRQCWFLAGPTACGKSEAAVEVALQIDAEIIAMDSMSLYRGMDIGTAKPTAQLRQAVPHHLVDVVEPHQEFSVAEYITAAERAVRDIVSRGRRPIFVGGTGLYLRSLLRGVFEGPRADPELRRSLEAEAARKSAEELHERLRTSDPVAARRIHPRDVRRIVRALEVHAVTGRPLSEWHRQTPLPPDERPRHVVWLTPPRAWLHDRINRRVEQMVADGLTDEVRQLLALPRPLGRTARQALGYQEAIDFLQERMTLEQMVNRIQTRTRQFAKRQHTWFRHIEECRPVEMSGAEDPSQLAERIRAVAELDS